MENTVKPYELRPLVASDMGAICKIITAIGIRQFKECFNTESFDMGNVKKEALKKAKEEELDETETQELVENAIDNATKQVGFGVVFDIAGIVIANMPKAEEEIQAFLASLTGMKASEVKAMPFADYGELIMQVVMKEDFQDFFKRVMKLFNR